MKGATLAVRGFTLVEMMIVVAIVAILVALAVPAYKDFTVRAKVTECIDAAAVPKVQISEYYQTSGRWPLTAADAGIDTTLKIYQEGLSQYCRLYFYNTGKGDFAILVNVEAIDPTLVGVQIIPVMSPVANHGSIDWFCTFGGTSSNAIKYLPASCRRENMF